MTQSSLAVLDGLKILFLESPLKPVTFGHLAGLIQTITELFDQAEEELTALAWCVDDLARHVQYQLEEKTK